MPLIKPSDANAPQYQTNTISDAKRIMERLEDLFAPHEYVRVKNIDNEPYKWSYTPPHHENISKSDDGRQSFRQLLVPEQWMLNPDDEDVLVGSNAYIMIDGLVKRLMQKKAVKANPEGRDGTRNFNFSDASAADKFIREIFIGKEVPTFGSSKESIKAK